ncbi:TAXI family TRAP transporter solute-binding subunit [Halococcus saccharolyticus]|uniref:TRAP-type transport system,periplasmic protein n=1 Tax=Halococcus saccharolyticus DSM 5350 TaxID=1227455 RepID=M0MJ42_9EURY|nr:TAXI family TRAP transporter solute-binding subunit [Halococcus saccharolyticus]EMA44749.1 TRAP-type transport system,periplasmic protein [Halococcus saccharolyticus DSM 5350]
MAEKDANDRRETTDQHQNTSRRRFLQTAGAVGVVGATGLAGCSGGGGGENGSGDNGSGGGETASGGEDTESGSGTESGAGNESGNESGGGGGGSSNLVWDAGGTGGTYFPLSNEVKQVVEDNTDFSLQVRSTGASVENVGSLSDGSADFALIQNDIASFAKNGEGIEAFEGNAVESLRGVGTLYPETITVVTPGDSDIASISDLSGATINTGDLGSGTQVDALTILEAVGVSDFTEQNTDFSQAAEQIQNGDIDAAFIVGGWPVGAIAELAETSSIGIIPIEGEERQQVKEAASFFADDEIPGGTYAGVDEAKPTVAVQAMIATTTEVPEATVETVTAAIFDNVSDLTIKTEFISAGSAQEGMSIELHPGAAAYFESTGGAGNATNASGGNMTEGGMTTTDGNMTGGNMTDGNMTMAETTESDAGNTTDTNAS